MLEISEIYNLSITRFQTYVIDSVTYIINGFSIICCPDSGNGSSSYSKILDFKTIIETQIHIACIMSVFLCLYAFCFMGADSEVCDQRLCKTARESIIIFIIIGFFFQ
jgi:hypothetical protein